MLFNEGKRKSLNNIIRVRYISLRIGLPELKLKMIYPFFIFLQENIFDKFGLNLVETSVKVRKMSRLREIFCFNLAANGENETELLNAKNGN